MEKMKIGNYNLYLENKDQINQINQIIDLGNQLGFQIKQGLKKYHIGSLNTGNKLSIQFKKPGKKYFYSLDFYLDQNKKIDQIMINNNNFNSIDFKTNLNNSIDHLKQILSNF